MTKYLKWFIGEVAGFRWTYIAVLLFQLVAVAISLVYVWLSKELVDTAVDHFNGAFSEKRLVVLAVLFAVVTFSRPLIASLKSYLQSKMSVAMTNSLRQRLFDDMLSVSGDVGRKYHSGDMINRMESDVSSVTTAFCSAVPN